jgi:hypothetical protein
MPEMRMTQDEVTLNKEPSIIGDVTYRFDFEVTRNMGELEVSITAVEVEDLENVIYWEDGSPVVLNADNKQKFIQRAQDLFWKKGVHDAEDMVTDKVRLGPVDWGQR